LSSNTSDLSFYLRQSPCFANSGWDDKSLTGLCETQPTWVAPEGHIFCTWLNLCDGKSTQLGKSTNFRTASVPFLWLWTEYSTLQWPYWLFWNRFTQDWNL